MRVLIINYEYPPLGGGAGIFNKYLIDQFAGKKGIHVDLVTSSTSLKRVIDYAENIRLHYLDIGKRDELRYQRNIDLIRFSIRALFYCKRLIRRGKIDVVHAFMGVPAGYIAYFLRKPCVISLHGSDVPFHNIRFAKLDKYVFQHTSRVIWRKAKHVISVSKDLAERAKITAPDQRIDVIYNGIDLNQFKPDSSVEKNSSKINLVFVGRFSPVKAPQNLLFAFNQALNSMKSMNVHLEFVGEGPLLDEMRAYVKQKRLVDYVTFSGFLDFENVQKAYQRSDVLVVPSLNEALGNIVLEAMACGLSVITTMTGAAELIDGNGIVVNTNDIDELAGAIISLCKSAEDREQMGLKSLELSKEYSWENCADQFIEYYRKAKEGQP